MVSLVPVAHCRFDVPIGSAGFTGSIDGCRLRVPYYRLKKDATNPA